MEKKYLLVLDAGTGAGRCSIFDLEGKLVGSDYYEWSYTTPYENKEIREFDHIAFWEILCKVTKGALSKAGIDSKQIIAVSSTSQREGIVVVDKKGREVYAAPNIDFRGEEQAVWLKQNFGQEMYDISGHWPSAMTAPSRLLWFKQHLPDVYEAMDTLMMISDWILFRLTGQVACEPSNACETLFFNISDMDWDYKLMTKLGIRRSLFPKVLSSGEQIGRVNAQAAAQTGLPEGIPVIMGGADTQCAVLGTGGLEEGHIAIVSGTSTPVQAVVNKPLIDSKARVRTCCYLPRDSWVIDSNARPTGVVYRWLRDTLYSYECGKSDKKMYDIMNKEAEDISPGCNGLMAFTGPSILNVSDQRDFPNMFFGLNPGYEKELCNRGLFARSVLENIAFAVRGNIEQIYEIIGYKPDKVYMTGGATKAPIQLRITADVLGLPIHVARCSEATSLGAAICAAVGVGAYDSFEAAVNAMVKKPIVEDPDPDLVVEYDKHYRKWKKIYDFMAENIEHLR